MTNTKALDEAVRCVMHPSPNTIRLGFRIDGRTGRMGDYEIATAEQFVDDIRAEYRRIVAKGERQ